MRSWPEIAADNNAAWCDAVCWTHGIAASGDGRVWTSPTRTPPLYPDAITLVADASASELIARIDASPGCSVKDSFASLDLTGYGFDVLFDAQWIVRTPSGAPDVSAGPRWTVVRDAEAFRVWEEAWRGSEGPSAVLRDGLLRAPAVTLLAAWADDRIVGGAVLTRSATVVGVSNVFAVQDPIAWEVWPGCVAAATALFPGLPLVGYESGGALDAARAHGFVPRGPLQVWRRG